MREYHKLLNSKKRISNAAEVRQDLASADHWKDAYWIGRYVYEQASGEDDKLSMEAFEKAFDLGLNIRVDRECFLTATQNIAKIYFEFRKYDEAVNKLMVLDSNSEQLPDWVNLYYASAQIHTENVLYWAEMPELLFKRIDAINESDPESVKKRRILFLEFLNRISGLSKTKDISEIDKDAILQKAESLGVLESRECLEFQAALGLIDYPEGDEDDSESNPDSAVDEASVYEEIKLQIEQMQLVVERQAAELSRLQEETKNIKLRAEELLRENADLKGIITRQTEELKAAKEKEHILQETCQTLEKQLSGSQAVKKQLEESAKTIGRLRAEAEDLRSELTAERENTAGLLKEAEKNAKIIDNLNQEILEKQETIQTLRAETAGQRVQIETLKSLAKKHELSLKAAEERAASLELTPETNTAREEPKTAPSSMMADVLNVENFLQRRQKILIIGGSETKESHLRGTLKSMGFDFSKDQLEFMLKYDNVKDFASRIVPWSSKYAGIIVGPNPHKATDNDGYNSFIDKLEQEEGYPHVERARDKSGNLKISNASIGDAMLRMSIHLQSVV